MPRRDMILLVGLFVALAALIGLGPGRSTSTLGSNASSHISGPQGALALHRWFTALGYQVERLEYAAFTLNPTTDLLIVLGPRERYTREEATAVQAWVAAGGTLLLAEERLGPSAPAAPLLAAFDLTLAANQDGAQIALAPVLQPILGQPATTRLEARTTSVLIAGAACVPLAGTTAAPVLVGLRHGEGYVFASSALYPFSNFGLRDDQNAAMVLNLLRRIPQRGRIVFDEFHHGFVGETNLRSLLLETPWGWAALYGCLVGAGYLALTGRRFGRPVPLRAETARRSSAEYLASMAGLLRRAGKRDYVRDHYRASFKRKLAKHYGLSPDLDETALVTTIAQTHPSQAQAVAELFARMAGPNPDEAALLKLVSEADTLLER